MTDAIRCGLARDGKRERGKQLIRQDGEAADLAGLVTLLQGIISSGRDWRSQIGPLVSRTCLGSHSWQWTGRREFEVRPRPHYTRYPFAKKSSQ